MTDPRPDDVLTVREVAAVLGRTTDHIRTLIYSGALPSVLDERTHNYLVRRDAVEAYRDGRAQPPPPMFAELGEVADRIEAAEKVVDDLINARNEAMRRWRYEHGASVTAIAAAARIGRQHATKLLPRRK